MHDKICTTKIWSPNLKNEFQNVPKFFEEVMTFTNYDQKLFQRQKKLHERNSGQKSINS